MLDIKKLLTKILSYFTIVRLDNDAKIYPTVTGWSPSYTTISNLNKYNMIYLRVFVKGTGILMFFPRIDNANYYTQYFDDAYWNGSAWTFGRMLIQVDWANNRIGLSIINGAIADKDMYVQGVWGTNRVL